MDNEEQLFNDRYPEMLRMAQLLTSQADAVLIGSFGTYLTYPQVLSKRPHDVDLFIEGSLENIKKIIELLKENGYTVYSWQDEIGENFDYSILPGRFYIRGIKDGLYMDATYEIVDLNFDDIRKYAILVEDILALNKEGQIIVLDRSDREESAKRANLLKNLYLVSNMVILSFN